MTGFSLGLVLVSALAHASWNFLLKRSADQEAFLWCLLASASVLLAPLGLALFLRFPIDAPGPSPGQNPGWWFVGATIGLHGLYFLALGRGYANGDLSLVYPIARGLGPILVPVLAVVFLGETIAFPALVGIAVVVIGIYTVALWGNIKRFLGQPMAMLKDPGTRYAVFTGLTIVSYAIVDKSAVAYVQPFLYMYLMTLGSAIVLTPYMLWGRGLAAVRRTWHLNRGCIILAGLLTFAAYGLVLTAMSLSRVSYVAPAREVGIVIGVLMGIFLLKEPFGRGRLLGSTFIILGLVLIALSP
jgi:drug/metabolite transporter (DMT)-like permease